MLLAFGPPVGAHTGAVTFTRGQGRRLTKGRNRTIRRRQSRRAICVVPDRVAPSEIPAASSYIRPHTHRPRGLGNHQALLCCRARFQPEQLGSIKPFSERDCDFLQDIDSFRSTIPTRNRYFDMLHLHILVTDSIECDTALLAKNMCTFLSQTQSNAKLHDSRKNMSTFSRKLSIHVFIQHFG